MSPYRSEETQRPDLGSTCIDFARACENENKTQTQYDGKTQAAPWRALFFFTTKSNLPLCFAGFVLSIVAGLVGPATAIVTGNVFDSLTSYASGNLEHNDFIHDQTSYVSNLLIIAGGSWLLHFLEFTVWLAFGELQAKSARDRLFRTLLDKDIEWYDRSEYGTGALLPRLLAQIRELQLATSQPLGCLISMLSAAILSFLQAFVFSWKLTLATVSIVPVVMGLVIWAGNGQQEYLDKQQEKLTQAQKVSVGAFSAIETVKCFNSQEMEHKKYMERIRDAAHWNLRVVNANAMQMGLVSLLSVLMFVPGFFYGAVLVEQGILNSGDVLTCFMSAVSGFTAVNTIVPQLIVMEKGRNAGTALRAVMAQIRRGSSRPQDAELLEPSSCHGDIEIRNLTFAYPSRPQRPALVDVTMSIPSGRMVFLIGKSGSGKSTLGQLLMRFYTPAQGHICLDGVALEKFHIAWVRSNVTLFEQSSTLFNDTIFRNIAFGKKNCERVTRREVIRVMEFALLQSTIGNLPKGLKTIVGYKGGAMSGGQCQRIALARSRLRDTPILILDEGTSALDRTSRALVMDAIREWRRGKTTVIITHDISQILPEDYTYILEHGKLVREGYREHMELQNNAPFQDLLPGYQRATPSGFDSRRRTNFESGQEVRGPSAARSPLIDTIANDSLENQSRACEKSMSRLPRTFEGGLPHGMANRFRSARMSAAVEPWIRLPISPLFTCPTSPQTPAALWGQRDRKDHDSSTNMYMENKQLPQDVQKVVEKTVTKRRHASQIELRAAVELTTLNSEESSSSESDSIEHRQSLRQIMSTMWPSINWHQRLILICGFAASTIHAAVSPVFGFVLSNLLNTYSVSGGDRDQALLYSTVILGLAFVYGISTYLLRMLLEYVSQCWVDNIRYEAMNRILHQPKVFFDEEENSVSRLVENLDRNAEEMRNLLGRFLGMAWIVALMVTITVMWSLAAQWKLTLATFASAPYIFICTKSFAAISLKWEEESNSAAEDTGTIMTEIFTNLKTVRALTLEAHFLRKYFKSTDFTLKIGLKRALLSGFFYGLSTSAGELAIALMFFVGAKLVHSGEATVRQVVQVFTMLSVSVTNVRCILDLIPQMGSSTDTASRLLRLAQLPGESHEHAGRTRISAVGEIVFRDVKFSYPSRPEQTVLKDLNLRIPPGSSTAIVGSSGSGKSTISNLLLNMYCTSNIHVVSCRGVGDRTLASQDIRNIHTPSLRSLIVPVSQSPILFAATIAENITYGLPLSSPYNTPASTHAAAKLAGIHDFVRSLPHGYATPVGEGGTGLSGGQAQRIAIARALVRNPSVLILDEATSALDVESATVVRDTIKTLVRDKHNAMTVLIITHNREMMEIADKIAVLDQGRIAEEGRFDELLATNGALASLLNGGEWNGAQ